MNQDEPGSQLALLATKDPAVLDCVSATALALGVELDVVADREQLRARWARSSLRLIGSDLAQRLGGLPTADFGTFVVGPGDSLLLAASAQLRVPALALPQATPQLAEVLTNQVDSEPVARLVAVVGASGGLGASCFAAALAAAAAATEGSSALVELARFGGGLDLLFGAETSPGLRWDELAAAAGQLGELAGSLVRSSKVAILPLARRPGPSPSDAAIQAVLRSLCRSQPVVILDAGSGEVLARVNSPTRTVLLVGAEVRSVAAARLRAAEFGLGSASLVVRRGAGRNLPAKAVARALGLPLLGVLRHDSDVPRLATAGASVVAARGLSRDARAIWQGLMNPCEASVPADAVAS